MAEQLDFEQAWLSKLSRCLEKQAGAEVREQVMAGSEDLSAESTREDVIAWSRQAMERLAALLDEEVAQAVMSGCACEYPKANLQDLREIYQATGDISRIHRLLQERFESFLRDGLQLGADMITEIVEKGWGVAGVLQGDSIVATKIPKSGYLVEYLQESDPEKRRQIYCHCPRIRDVLKSGETIPPIYCYCGAGFYKGIWEEILQRPVHVELLESVLMGDDACKIRIDLPI
jgi:predicted hydrocarbon binding protein